MSEPKPWTAVGWPEKPGHRMATAPWYDPPQRRCATCGKPWPCADKRLEEMQVREPSAAPVAKTYRTVLDGDSHRYLIPTARDEEWNQLVELGEFDEPEWAERIDGEAFDGLPADVANILLQALRECVDRRESCDDEPAYITRARAALAAATGAK